MRKGWLLVLTLSTSLVACADVTAPQDEGQGPTPFDGDEFALATEAEVRNPDKTYIPPEDIKLDGPAPRTYSIAAQQSPVKSQGSRGVCSIFATVAQVENLYLKAGAANPDFSEQFLQWSSKNEYGAFRNSEGSSGAQNLATVVRYGIVEESAWRYESAPWTEANDAACTGESRPTRCYTNGEPPASALAAPRFKVPSSRWINIASMKDHLVAKNTGIVVGMTFFYQAWNHRRSELPVNADYWRKGYVTYPNARDQEVSLAKRAGHAIVIVGWDDDLEVAMRDEAGNPILDANGQPKKEKGFWLFKNSWGTTGFGIEHPAGPGYGWLSYKYVAQYGDAVIGEIPNLTPPAEVCDDAAKVDEDRDGKANCEDSDCAAHSACQPAATTKTYEVSPAAAIPDNQPAGLTSTIPSTDAGTIRAAKITLDISHTYRGDLKVVLVHDGVTTTLANRSGGNKDNIKETIELPGLAGKAVGGDWTLKVVDAARADVGKLNSWKVEVSL